MMQGNEQVKAQFNSNVLFTLQNLAVISTVTPEMIEDASLPMMLALMRASIGRLEAIEESRQNESKTKT